MDAQSGRYDAALRESLLQDVTLSEPPTPHQDDTSTAKIGTELKSLARLSAPVIVQLTAQYAISVVNQLFIGHLGARPLAAAAIGNTVRPTAQHVVVHSTHFSGTQRRLCSLFPCFAVVQFLLVLSAGSLYGP